MSEILDYTGERMVPERADSATFWEHVYRYRFACRYVGGKRVLDIACGEGYGSAAMRSAGASSVIGVDIAPDAVEHAKQKYAIDARVGDAARIPVADKSVDVVVSFETIEHVEDPSKFIDECDRVLGPGGILVISTPHKDVYRTCTPNNPFHVSELSEAEFRTIVGRHFPTIQMFEQQPTRVWWNVRGPGRVAKILRHVLCPHINGPRGDDTTSLILAQDRPLAELVNQYAIKPHNSGSQTSPIFFIAVATR